MTSMPPPGYDRKSVGSWSYVAPQPQPPAEDRLSRRLLQVAGLLSVLLIAVVVNALLEGGDENPLNPIAEAAERTQSQPGSRSDFEATYTSPALAHPLLMSGRGVYNAVTGRSRATMTAPAATGTIEMDVVGDNRSIYMRSQPIAEEIPPGKQWLGIQPWLGQTAETALAGNGDAQGQLEMLGSVGGDVNEVGSAEVRGVPTTEYQGNVDLGHFADSLRKSGNEESAEEYERMAQLMPTPSTVYAWIDDNGLLRQMRLVMELPSPTPGTAVTMDMRMEFFDFGITPEIDIPAPAEVFDVTPLVRARLHMLDGKSVGAQFNPAVGPALSSAEFQRRGNAICDELLAQAHDLKARSAPQLEALESDGHEGGDPGAIRADFRELALTYMEPVVTDFNDGLRRLGELSPPAGAISEFQRFLHISAIEMEVLLARTRAWEVGGFATVKDLGERSRHLSQLSDQSAERLGLDSCIGEKDSPGTAA